MDVAALKENRKKKNALLKQMLALTEQQLSQLEAEEMEQFSQTAKSWEALSKEVDELEAEYRNGASGAGNTPAPNGWAVELGLLNDESRRLLLEISRLREQCTVQAEKSMGKYKSDMKDAQKSFQRVTSYVNPYTTSEDGIYFDQKK